jgi:hypothetical protein
MARSPRSKRTACSPVQFMVEWNTLWSVAPDKRMTLQSVIQVCLVGILVWQIGIHWSLYVCGGNVSLDVLAGYQRQFG